MSDTNDQDTAKGRLSLRPAGRLELGRTVDAGSVRQSFSHGRSKVVQVEVRKKRATLTPPLPVTATPIAPVVPGAPPKPPVVARPPAGAGRALTATEVAVRQRVLQEQAREQARRDAERREQEKISILSAAEEARRREEDARKAAEEEARQAAEEAARVKAEEAARAAAEAASAAPPPAVTAKSAEEVRRPARPAPSATPSTPVETLRLKAVRPGEDDEAPRRRPGMVMPGRKPVLPVVKKVVDDRRRPGRIDVQAAIEGDDDKSRSLASVRRQRERERRQAELELLRSDQVKVVRDVVLPEAITVQELANRMAARGAGGDQVADAHGRDGDGDAGAGRRHGRAGGGGIRPPQPPGQRERRGAWHRRRGGCRHRTAAPRSGGDDHGPCRPRQDQPARRALRSTDVAAGEAGGITQHIGAYQVQLVGHEDKIGGDRNGPRITFIDTPGHEAFTAMRSRGASVTDIVVLVVAADDGVMPQTIEAIRHAKAANAPLIVAINKMDRPDANPSRVRQELLSFEVVVEEMGGETQDVEVSATQRTGLDKLEEAILLQAEILDLRANPDRAAEGSVIESRLDRGRGPVATVLVQKGTLNQGDIVVAGAEWGRVRAMLDDKGKQIKVAGPSTPVEILGLSSVPTAGEPFVAVENEARAREISEFRQRKLKDRSAAGATAARGTLEEMLARAVAGELKEVAILVKADVQGSAEAIQGAVLKLAHEEVKVRVLLSAVGQITESDVQLARASDAVIVAFNVRATSQARELAQRDGVDIRYYSIIYDVSDDIEKMVKGKVAPKARRTSWAMPRSARCSTSLKPARLPAAW